MRQTAGCGRVNGPLGKASTEMIRKKNVTHSIPAQILDSRSTSSFLGYGLVYNLYLVLSIYIICELSAPKHLPDERTVHNGHDGNGQQGDGVWFVEEVQRNIIHRSLVDVRKGIDRCGYVLGAATLMASAAAAAGRSRRRRSWSALLHDGTIHAPLWRVFWG